MRTQKRQTAHNRAVGRIAAYYGSKGYTVWADLPAYREKGMKPSEVFGKVPDIIAQRPARIDHRNIMETVIIEVETSDTQNGSHALAQKRAFERAERQWAWTEFRLHVVRQA